MTRPRQPNPNALPPVSREATEAAFTRVFKRPSTNQEVYARYRGGAFKRQPELERGLDLMCRASGLLIGQRRMSVPTYFGSALAYFASREEQAKMDDTTLPTLEHLDFASVLMRDVTEGGGAAYVPQVLSMMVREIPTDDFLDYMRSHQLEGLEEHELRVMVTSPSAERNIQMLGNLAASGIAGMNARVAEARVIESEFMSFASNWWTESHPAFVASLQSGAADMREALNNAARTPVPS